jgi:hypothetical protein
LPRGAVGARAVLWNRAPAKEEIMRTFQIVLWLAVVMVIACKKPDKPAEKKPDEAAKVADPAKPGEPPAPAPADPAAAPADPGARAAAAEPAKPSAPAATGDLGTNTPLQAKGVVMMEKMSDLFAEHADDCDKLAMELRSMISSNKDLMVELRTMEAGMTGKDREAYEARNKSVQEDVFEKMGPAMQRCGDKVLAAMRDIPK